jgi:prepilin-type N-terminal cleavage/methylation domain-containing protein
VPPAEDVLAIRDAAWEATSSPGPAGGFAMRRPRGFTLVELLVVIGIIVLLVGILLPAVNRARLQVKEVGCIARMRQVGTAVNLYVQSHEDQYPGQVGGLIPLSNADSWVYKLRAYVKQNEIYSCTLAYTYSGDDPQPAQMTYIYNGFASGAFLPGNKPARITQIRKPTETLLVADHAPYNDGSWVIGNVEGYPYGWYWWYPHPAFRPDDGPNNTRGMRRSACFADGHAELVPRNTMEQWQLDWRLQK